VKGGSVTHGPWIGLAFSEYSERCEELSEGGGEGRTESMMYGVSLVSPILLLCGKVML
jgi:hypothetical protein